MSFWGMFILTHIPQVRSQNVVFLKYEFFRITNQSTRYR
ncbi:Arsenic resistance protein ArsH [Richelia intracellularis]|nr:Arsenic resistance protein ArsH [Richelia intracellularis]